MLTAEVFALTTSVDRQVTMSTHCVAFRASVLVLMSVSSWFGCPSGRAPGPAWSMFGPGLSPSDPRRSSEPGWSVVAHWRDVVVPAAQDVVRAGEAGGKLRVVLAVRTRPVVTGSPYMRGVGGSEQALPQELSLV